MSLKHLKLFEDFQTPLDESWMSEIDIVKQESENEEEFKKKLKDFLEQNDRKDLANDAKWIEEFTKMYFPIEKETEEPVQRHDEPNTIFDVRMKEWEKKNNKTRTDLTEGAIREISKALEDQQKRVQKLYPNIGDASAATLVRQINARYTVNDWGKLKDAELESYCKAVAELSNIRLS